MTYNDNPDMEIKSSECFRGLTELESLNIQVSSDTVFDFNDIPTSIKNLQVYNPNEDPFETKNIDRLKDFINLETLNINEGIILQNKDKFCDWMKNWPNIKNIGFREEIKNLKDFDCSKWINDLISESQERG